MTIKAKVYQIIFQILEENKDGIQWSNLLEEVIERNSSLHPKTVNGLIWKLVQTFPTQVYKSDRGRFRLTKYKEV